MISPEDAFLALEALISTKRAAFKRPLRISVAIAEHGTMVLDTKREVIAEAGWDDQADLALFANAETMSDLLLGRFDPEAPKAEHLLLFSGSDEDWRVLVGALSGAKSMIDLRASASNKTAKSRR
jgi:hypothetical protein